MAYLNKVFLIGNLTRDPELRVTPKGTAICSFGLAVNRQYRDENGTARDETTFVDIEAWGKQGELVSKYLTKGSPCMVEGRLRLDFGRTRLPARSAASSRSSWTTFSSSPAAPAASPLRAAI
jgi:single stranded DNA-binding protein